MQQDAARTFLLWFVWRNRASGVVCGALSVLCALWCAVLCQCCVHCGVQCVWSKLCGRNRNRVVVLNCLLKSCSRCLICCVVQVDSVQKTMKNKLIDYELKSTMVDYELKLTRQMCAQRFVFRNCAADNCVLQECCYQLLCFIIFCCSIVLLCTVAVLYCGVLQL